MNSVKTRTGEIFYDTDRRLEFLYVGDYGKEANIKANFLGLKQQINGVAHKHVDLSEKMVVTISTQKGCPMRCKFCDVPKYGYHGNVSRQDLEWQVMTAILESKCIHTNRLNIHYARMGEPTFNREVLHHAGFWLNDISYIKADVVHPVVSTMMPKSNKILTSFLDDWCFIKNEKYNGDAGLQLSINSTDDLQRDFGFNGMSLPLVKISEIADKLPIPIGRKYTLNFAVTKDTILDSKVLSSLFDKNKFIVKITPIHETKSALNNHYDIEGYSDYNVYEKFETPLIEDGWDVIVFIPSKEEDEDRITCGNALISTTV